MKKVISILSLLCVLCAEPLLHASVLPEKLKIQGFASQGFILTSDNNFFGNSKDGSFDFSELGVNTSIRPIPDLLFSAQGLSRRAGKDDDGDLQLDYALIDYSFFSKESGNFGLRLGRIKNPLGLYNDTRDVAFTRPSIFLPQSIYFDRTRNLALSADSIQIYADYRSGIGNLIFQFGVGYPNVDNDQTRQVLLGKQPGEIEGELSYLGRLIFEQGGGKFRLGLSTVILNMQPKIGNTEGSIRFLPIVLSSQYNTEFWSLTSEYALRHFRYQDVKTFPNFSKTGESFYLQFTYRLNKKVEVLLRHDMLFQDRNDRNGTKFEAGPRSSGKPAHSQFAKDWTAGLLWDITQAWMGRIEYHYIDGTAWLPFADNPSATKRYWDMLALLISYRF